MQARGFAICNCLSPAVRKIRLLRLSKITYKAELFHGLGNPGPGGLWHKSRAFSSWQIIFALISQIPNSGGRENITMD
jgi:hypothetical protein